jgi:hypothetical protein
LIQQNDPRRFIEVELSNSRCTGDGRREKSIRLGHISTMHILVVASVCLPALRTVPLSDPAVPACPWQRWNTAVQQVAYNVRSFLTRMEKNTLEERKVF